MSCQAPISSPRVYLLLSNLNVTKCGQSKSVCATVKGADELYIFVCYTMSIVIGQCTVVFETRRTHDQADPSLLFLSLAGKQQHVVIHAVRLVVFI